MGLRRPITKKLPLPLAELASVSTAQVRRAGNFRTLSVKPFGFKAKAGGNGVLVPNAYVSRENEVETRFRNPSWRADLLSGGSQLPALGPRPRVGRRRILAAFATGDLKPGIGGRAGG